MSEFTRQLKTYAQKNLGLAFFLAWNYISLYGCAMAVGVFIPYNLEYIWIVAGAIEGLTALVVLAIARKRSIANRKAWGVAAAVCAVAANFFLWISYIVTAWYFVTFAIAGVLYGIVLALLTTIWGSELSKGDSSQIEFDVMLSFAISFALYCITLPIKLYGTVDLAIASILPIASVYLAFRKPRSEKQTASAENASNMLEPQKRIEGAPANAAREQGKIESFTDAMQSLSTFAMIGGLWFLIAFFRVLSAPVGSYDRYQHYFFPFCFAFVITVALFIVFIKAARHLSITLAFRWTLPFLLLGFSVLSLDYGNISNHIVAFSMNYMGMFGMQISCWMATAKHLHRSGSRASITFLCLAASEGLGIFVGCGIGLLAVHFLTGTTLLAFSMLIIAGVVFLVMLTGFNPAWRYDGKSKHRFDHVENTLEASRKQQAEGKATAVDFASLARDETDDWRDPFMELIRRKSLALQKHYGLTERETEIAELLLAGRSRPYIRDELVISLNTVHTHASNIFAKCDVHSQQEFIDLAHQE